MSSAIIVTERAEILLSAGLILLIILAIFLLARRPKPDPKMALLLSHMEAMPKDSVERAPANDANEETGGKDGHGPMGSSGFTLSV